MPMCIDHLNKYCKVPILFGVIVLHEQIRSQTCWFSSDVPPKKFDMMNPDGFSHFNGPHCGCGMGRGLR